MKEQEHHLRVTRFESENRGSGVKKSVDIEKLPPPLARPASLMPVILTGGRGGDDRPTALYI